MTTFVDTSGLLAVLDADDAGHARAARAWRQLLESDEALLTSSHVLVELYALAQRRLGMDAVRSLATDFAPLLDVVWVDEPIHEAALSALLVAGARGLSLVDCTSFEVMRRTGFEVVPRGSARG